MTDWPFDDPMDVAVISIRQIVFEGHCILHVTHDASDGYWQFLCSDDANEENAVVVALSEIVEMDPSLKQIADLPLGWHAWRVSTDDPWIRGPNPSEENEE